MGKAGVYISSFSRTVNGNLTDDEISAVTNNISEILSVSYEKLYFTADEITGRYKGKAGYLYKATVEVKIDDAEISKYLTRDAQEKFKIILQNKNLQRTLAEIDNDFENLSENADKKTPAQIQAELNKIDNEISAAEKISEGNKFAYQRNYQSAVKKYNEAIEINQNSNAAKKNLESIYSEQKNIEQVIKDYGEEVPHNPQSAEDYSNLGMYCYYKKNYEQAIKYYNIAIQLKPKYVWCYYDRGLAYYELKNYYAALEDFTKAIQLQPNNAVFYWHRRFVYIELGEKNKAEEDLKKFRKIKG